MTTRTAVPSALGLLSAALVSAGFCLGGYTQNLHNGLIAAGFTGVGVFVLSRRPGHREAWLFLATGVAHALMFFGRQYGFRVGNGGRALPAVEWVTWIGVWPLPLVLVLVGVTVMSFPDGRLPSTRWQIVVTIMLAVGAVLAVMSALWPVDYADNALAVPHPLRVGGYDTARDLWPFIGPTAYTAFQLAWVVCVILRLRRARGDEASQLKWFVYAVSISAVAMVAGLIVFRSATVGVLSVPIIPIAAGAAIVNHRLYDIDVVINKTLVVGTMAAIISAAYVALVVGVGTILGLAASPNVVLSLIATAVIAVAFDPLRRRVQRWVDRLVYGDRPTPYEALSRLSAQLNQEGERNELFAGLASAVADGVGASEVTLWVGSGEELVSVASWPPTAGQDATHTAVSADLDSLGRSERTHVRPIVHQGTLRGAITLTKAPGEALTASDDRLLHDLTAQVGLVIDNVWLGAELQDHLHQISIQAAELRAAAKRIVAAQDAARRRIERDLHDGAQQRLVTLALSLHALSERATSLGDDVLAVSVDDARAQLLAALSDLREMARGIHPAILSDEGLKAALGFIAERSRLPVHVDLRLDRRLGPDVEATAYFVVCEALTNAAKHSHASSVTVSGALHDGMLTIEVSDNGRGGADGRWASGLQGLTDRLATLNGVLTIHSPPGGGTRLHAAIPCG